MEWSKVLVDGDIFAYRAAFATEDKSKKEANLTIDGLLQDSLEYCLGWPNYPEDYEIFLTCSGYQFRHDIAKTHKYKGNRSKREKPRHLPSIREHMISDWGAVVSVEEEADDLIAIAATKNNFDCVVASIDKDMLQIPCWHYNHFKNVLTKVEPFEGNKFFYTQILTGDSADNIHGLSQVGPVKASNILKGLETEQDMWDAVLDAYDGAVDRVLENARLLWLRRYEGEIWQPPDKR